MTQKLIKYIEIDEVKKLIAATKDRKMKLAISLGFGSGLRISEVVGYEPAGIKPLTIEQIDLDKHQIRILGKGKKERITITSKWLNKTNIQMLPLKINRRTLQRQFSILCKKVLKKKMSFHTLRHGFGNHLVNVRNTPLPQVQILMGHSRIDTTGIYTKANPVKAVEDAWENF